MFEFERLIVFEKALDAAAAVDELVRAMPHSRHRMKDQVSRSVDSLVLNIAEGSGEFTRKEKARFYRIARRSACETAGALKLSVRYGMFPASRIAHAMKLLNECAAMLTTMCNRLAAEARKGRGSRERPAEGARAKRETRPLTASASASARPTR